MYFYHRIITLLIGICSVLSVFAQQEDCDLRLFGNILDEEGRPVAGAKVVLQPGNRTTYSDQQGGYSETALCQGRYTVIITAFGFQSVQQEVDIRPGNSPLHVQLSYEPLHIQDIHVNGVRSDMITHQRHQVSEQQRQETKGKTLADMLSTIAGVTQLTTGNSIKKPVINGLHSNRVLLLNQGVRQEGQQWGSEHAPEIDPFTADNLEVVKGAQAVRYGADALGGVVISEASAISTDRITGRVDAIGQSNGRGIIGNIRLEGGIPSFKNFGWRVQASSKRIGNMKTADYYLGNTGVAELNGSMLLQYQTAQSQWKAYYSHFGTELGIFYGAHVNNREDILANIALGRPSSDYAFDYHIRAPKQAVSHDLAKISWQRTWTPRSSLSIQYAFQNNRRKEFDLRRVASDDTPMADMQLQTQTLDLQYRNNDLRIGMSGQLQVNNNVPGTGTTPIIPNFDNHNLGVFAIQELHRGRWHSEFGLRYDYRYFDVAGYRYDYTHLNTNGGFDQYLMTDRKEFHNLSGTMGTAYHFNQFWTLKSNLALAWRAPSANELYSDGLHHGSGIYEIGRADLKSEKGYKWITALQLNNDRWDGTLEVYGQLINDYIYAAPNPDSVRQTIRGTFPVFSYTQQNAVFAGADVQVRYRISERLNYQVSASTVYAKDIDHGTFLPFIPSDRVSNSLAWQLTNDDDARVRLRHSYVAQQRRFEAGTDYSNPPKSYQLWDIFCEYPIAFRTQKVTCNLSLENVFNTLYKDYMDRFRYYAHQPGRNITLGITYQF